MSSWRKVKRLFWQSGQPGADENVEGRPPEGELTDAEFAEFLAENPHAVPPGGVEAPVEGSRVPVRMEHGAVSIDFQAQYDAAGIPDTDEAEQLENFLARLDDSL